MLCGYFRTYLEPWQQLKTSRFSSQAWIAAELVYRVSGRWLQLEVGFRSPSQPHWSTPAGPKEPAIRFGLRRLLRAGRVELLALPIVAANEALAEVPGVGADGGSQDATGS